MRKMIVVAVREYQAAVKTKAFLVSLIAMPVLWGGSVVLQMAIKDKVDVGDKRIAVLDYSGQIFEDIAEAAGTRNQESLENDGIYEGQGPARRQVKPRFLFERVEPSDPDPPKAALALSERIRRNEGKDILAFVVIDRDVVDPDAGQAAIRYHSNSPTYDDIQDWLVRPINARIQELRMASARLDPTLVKKITAQRTVGNVGLVTLDEAGNIQAAEETNEMANIFVPMGLMTLMLMVVMVGASPLVHSVLEEKTLRIAEVLLGSIAPFPLMMGKLIGMVGVSLTIVVFYLAGAYFAIRQAGYGQFFPGHVIWWFVVFQALAVLMYGALFVAVGAAVSDMKEAQSMITPVTLLAVLPMFVWINVVKEPTSSFALTLSLIPPATPMLMVLRQAVPPGIPIWQPVLGIVLVLLATIACVFAAGRIFRVGILMQGKGARFGEMMRWVIRG